MKKQWITNIITGAVIIFFCAMVTDEIIKARTHMFRSEFYGVMDYIDKEIPNLQRRIIELDDRVTLSLQLLEQETK